MSKLWRKTLRNAENWSGLASHKGKKKHLFTKEFKTQVVSYAEERSNRSVVSHYVVEHKAVREWKKDIKKIKATQTRRQRFEGGGRKWKAEETEDELVHCIYRKKKFHVSRKMIIWKAKNIFNEGKTILWLMVSLLPIETSVKSYAETWALSQKKKTQLIKNTHPT